MVAPASGSSNLSQAAIDHAAALAAAEDRRRQAEEAARRAAEEAKRRADEARRLADEARQRADTARRAAEAAEAKAAASKNEVDRTEARALRTQSDKDELDALKKEATSNLFAKEKTLADSKLDDVRQRRAPENPSEATRAAQVEVDAARKTNALYEPPAGQPAADRPAPSAGTQALLEKAQQVAKPVFDAQAAGGDGTPAQKAALNVAVTDWLDAAQQDMRTAGLTTQAEGQDPNAAIDREAARINQAIDEGGVFDPKAMGAYVDKAQAGVKAETPAIRQLRSEQYDVAQSGKKQVGDARTAATEADAAADKAETYAASFGDGPGGNDTVITAKQNANDEAARLRGVANQADAKLAGLVKAFGTSDPSDPGNPKTNVVGAANADYNARVADLEVKDLGEKYDLAVTGGDPAQIAKAETALREAQDGQRYMHALRDDEGAKLDLNDSEIEYTEAEGAWNAEAQRQPGTYEVTERDGDKQTTKTVKAEGYDPAFRAAPGTEEGKNVRLVDGKYYYVEGDKKTELNPVTARFWAAHDKREASRTRASDTADGLAKVEEDLIGGADGSGPKLDAGTYVDNAGAINQQLVDASDAVAKASPQDLGAALEKQRTAQSAFDALTAMQNLRSAERDQAAGKPVDEGRLADLRRTAREAQRKHEESKPRLSADDEKNMREVLLPQAAKDYQAKSDAVDKLTAPGSTATQAERDKAQNELDTLGLARRDYVTQLGLIDAERNWYAAQNQYGQAVFAKPQLSMFMKNGESVTADVYPQNYDPTWNLKPGEDGRVSAEGLPRGLSPDDIEVRRDLCGGGYTVVIKKDSEVVGWQKSDRYGDMRHFTVREGEYRMNPATARLWETSEFGDGGLAQARAERGKVEQQLTDARAEAPPVPGEKPLIGPDGKPVPTLGLGDDLTQRKKTVDQNVGTATTERDKAQAAYDAGTGDRTALRNALDDANARLTIATNEQAAVDAALLWQEARRTRQLHEANERAGRAQALCHAKPPAEMESDARASAVAARGKWLDSHNRFYTDRAQRDLGSAQAAHDTWKRDNPSLAETGSDTWKALQAAEGQVDAARRYQVAGATDSASAREQDFIARNLRPDQHDDGAELYKLFMRDPELMAQSIVNSHYVQFGGQFTQMQSRTQLENQVAIALGWKPDVAPDPATPANNERLQQTQSLFTQLDAAQKEVLDKMVNKLVELGSDKAKVMVLPVVYGLDGEQGGIVKTALFKVETKPGETKYVDEQGWEYDSLDDYRANNNLPVEGVNLVTPEDGNFTLDADGNVKLLSGDARTETGWETFRRKTHLDVVVGVAGLAAGVVLTVGSLGTLSAPGVMLMAGSAAVLAAGYGIATSTESLVKQGSHGQDINPFTSTQARLDWMNLGLSVVSVPVVGASTRATMQAMRAGNSLKAASAAHGAGDAAAAEKHLSDFARYAQSAQAWGKPAAAAAKPLGVGSAVAVEEGARYMADNWAHMTPGERQKQVGMLGLNLAGFASPVFARGYVRVHNAVKPMANAAHGQTAPTNARATSPNEDGTDSGNVVPLASRRNPAAAEDPLLPFREQPAQRSSDVLPDNVRALHPDGPPSVAIDASPDAALAPVIPLVLRRPAGGGTEPGGASMAPASARRPQDERLAMAAGGEDQVANAPYTRSPQRAALERQRLAGARGHAGNGAETTGKVRANAAPDERPVVFGEHELTHMLSENIGETQPHSDPARASVRYMTPAMREQHRLTVDAGGRLLDSRGHLFDTSHNRNADEGTVGRGGFVLDRYGDLFYFDIEHIPLWRTGDVGGEPVGGFESGQVHASPLAGDPVAMAGEWQVRNGVVDHIANTSGHYQPTTQSFARALEFLHQRGVVKRHTEIEIYEFGPRGSDASASARRRARPAADGTAPNAPGPWRIVHGQADPLARDINPSGSDTNCVNSAVTLDRMLSAPGVAMQAVPSGPKSWAQLLALYGDAPLSYFRNSGDALAHVATLPEGSRGVVSMGDAGGESHVVNFVRREGRTELIDAQAGRRVDSFDASEVKVMVTHEGGTMPVDRTVLSGPQLASLVAASPDAPPPGGPGGVLAGTPGGASRPGFDADGVPSADEAAIAAALMADPPAGSSVRFVVSRLGPRDTIYGSEGGVRTRNRDTYDNFADASAAAARDGGGYVNRVRPDAARIPLVARRRVGADEIVGAIHVDGDGQPLPIAVPNSRDAAALAAATGVPSWKQGIKGALSEQPKDALIRAKGMTMIAGGARIGFEAMKPAFGLPADLAGGRTAGYLGYPLSSFGRAAYLTASQRMKESMAAATRGDRATAEKLVEKVIGGSGWRGDKIMDAARAQSLRDKVNEVATLGEAFDAARLAWADAPSARDFELHTIQSPESTPMAPASYLKGVPGLRDFVGRLAADRAGEFNGRKQSEIRSELLLRIDRMTADELRLATDRSHPDDSPEARLLREFPQLAAKLGDSLDQRAELRAAHGALHEKLDVLFGGDKGIDPQAAEGLGGSTNSPNTRLGLFSRRATIAVSFNTFVGTIFKPLNAGDSLLTHAGNFADVLSIGTLGANYVYNNKVDALATIDLKVANQAKAAHVSVDDHLAAHPALKNEQKAAKDDKDKWNKYRDYAGLLSAGRATAVGMGLLEAGPEVLAYGAFAQAGLTLTWVGLQQIPALRNGAFLTASRILKWSAVGSIALVPAATVLYKAIAGTEQEKKESVVRWAWNGFTGLFENPPAKPGQPAPSTSVAPPGHGTEKPDEPGKPVEPTPPKEPVVRPILVTVDGDRRETATLWGISESNLQNLLTGSELAAARQEGGSNHVVSEALAQLFNLNPRFDRRLMDGIATNVDGDPDTVVDGWQIKVGQTTV